MDITLESVIVQEVFKGQLQETLDNRLYLMCVIRQLEKNHQSELERIERDHQGELERVWQERQGEVRPLQDEVNRLKHQVTLSRGIDEELHEMQDEIESNRRVIKRLQEEIVDLKAELDEA